MRTARAGKDVFQSFNPTGRSSWRTGNNHWGRYHCRHLPTVTHFAWLGARQTFHVWASGLHLLSSTIHARLLMRGSGCRPYNSDNTVHCRDRYTCTGCTAFVIIMHSGDFESGPDQERFLGPSLRCSRNKLMFSLKEHCCSSRYAAVLVQRLPRLSGSRNRRCRKGTKRLAGSAFGRVRYFIFSYINRLGKCFI